MTPPAPIPCPADCPCGGSGWYCEDKNHRTPFHGQWCSCGGPCPWGEARRERERVKELKAHLYDVEREMGEAIQAAAEAQSGVFLNRELAEEREKREAAEIEVTNLRGRLSHLVNHCEQVTIRPDARCVTIVEARASKLDPNCPHTQAEGRPCPVCHPKEAPP